MQRAARLVKSGIVRSGSVMSGNVMSGNVMSGSVMSGNVMSGRVTSGSVTSGSVTSESVTSGSSSSPLQRSEHQHRNGKSTRSHGATSRHSAQLVSHSAPGAPSAPRGTARSSAPTPRARVRRGTRPARVVEEGVAVALVHVHRGVLAEALQLRLQLEHHLGREVPVLAGVLADHDGVELVPFRSLLAAGGITP